MSFCATFTILLSLGFFLSRRGRRRRGRRPGQHAAGPQGQVPAAQEQQAQAQVQGHVGAVCDWKQNDTSNWNHLIQGEPMCFTCGVSCAHPWAEVPDEADAVLVGDEKKFQDSTKSHLKTKLTLLEPEHRS